MKSPRPETIQARTLRGLNDQSNPKNPNTSVTGMETNDRMTAAKKK